MKLFDFIKEKIAKIPLSSSTKSGLISFFGGGTYQDNSSYYNGWVYLAVAIISQEVAGIKLKLFKKDKKGNVEQVFDHPSLDLIKDANDFMTQYDLFERLQANQELQGNEYWFLTFAGKTPNGIYPLPPTNVKPIADKYEYVSGYMYTVDGKQFVIPKENIIHFKQFNPSSDIVGFATLEAVKFAAQTDIASKKYNLKYFQNDARPDVVIEIPDSLDPDQEKRILEAWNQNHAGPDRQFRTAVASGGLKINSFQITQRDMEYLEGRKFSRDEIMAIFRVPLTVAGLTGNETYASAKAADYSFGKRTITPKMRRIVNTLNEFLLSLYPDTEGMYFTFESPVTEDRDLVIKGYEAGIRNGWLSINDVRRAEDLPEIEGGEPVMVPFNVQPLGEPKAKQIEVSKPISKAIRSSMETALKVFDESKKKEAKDESPRYPHLAHMDEKQRESFDRQGEYMSKARNERGLEFENQFNSILNELWEGQKQRAINNLIGILNSKNWKAKGPNVIDNEKEIKITFDLLMPLMLALTEKEAEAAMAYLGTEVDQVITPNLRKFIEANAKLLAGEITDVTTKRVRAEVAAGLEAGEAIDDIKERILNSTAFSKARSENIARTETIRAQGKAQIEVWKESGVVEGKLWYTAVDERVCPYCDPMNGKTIGISDSFFKKGDVQTGNDGGTLNLDYEDVGSPPLHPQCRCVLIPQIIS